MNSKAFRAMMAASLLLAVPSFAARRPAENEWTGGATILCYHIVESPHDPRMEISRETFRQQMDYLAMTGYTVVPLKQIYEYATGKRASLPRNAVAITMDDGWRSAYTEAFPELQRRHFPFTVFIYPRIIGQTAYALTWRQIKEMAKDGVDVESHSYSHPFLTRRRHADLDEKQYSEWLERELVESKKILEHETGKTVNFLAYPYGDYDHFLAASVAKAGYEGALTCEYGPVTHGMNPFRLRRVVIDKRMDFAAFRHYLGTRPMPLEDVSPQPGQILDPGQPGQPVTVSAKIPIYKNLDPKSVGMALLSMTGEPIPYSYDAASGLISLVADEGLTGTLQRALVWATDLKSGRRVEASWTFRVPEDPANCPAIDPGAQRATSAARETAVSASQARASGPSRLQN
ncbi:MAG TPA: polysaccharide deacetylase family protein [Thermoanaerobaculia bacterium]|nr:polysaccharide deacetylase family protein [Thermoanaerobaculia bacterium]